MVDDNKVVHLDAGLWTVKPGEFVKAIREYIKEFKIFNPDNFMLLSHFMVKGDKTRNHKENLCEIVDTLGFCKKCKYNKTDECPRGIKAPEGKITTSVKLLTIADSLHLFHDSKTGYAFMNFGGDRGYEVVPLKSEDFEDWLSLELFAQEGTPPAAEAVKSAINILHARARSECTNYKLYNRVAMYNDEVYYDLCNRGRVVLITSEGWEILDKSPIPLFKKYDHQKSSFEPIQQGERSPKELREGLEEFLQFVNHDQSDLKFRIGFIIDLVSYFLEGFAHPILSIQGEHGTAKTGFGELVKWLIDNSSMLNTGIPRGSDNLIQALEQHWFIFFDNVSEIYDWQSDIFCRTVTGTSQQTRKLYTNDGVIIRSFRRCISLNAIEKIIIRPDLVDRTFVAALPQIKKKERRSDKEVRESFEKAGPRILGTIFDVISETLAIRPLIEMDGLYRLADWTIWCCAISRAIGINESDFLKAYDYNRALLRDEAIASNDVAATIYALMQERDTAWEGIMTELYDKLIEKAADLRISTTEKSWPKKANALSRKLPRVMTNLREIGIEIKETGERDDGNRKVWRITSDGIDQRVESKTQEDVTLERYLNDVPDDIVSSESPETAIESTNNDINDTNDISSTSVGDIPKDEEKDGKRGTKSKGVEAYEKRWYEFLERSSDFGKHAMSEWNLDKLYKPEEKGQLEQDLKDWEKEGRILRNKKGEWRVVDRGAPTKEESEK